MRGGTVACQFLAGVLHPKQAMDSIFPLTGRECSNQEGLVLAPSSVGASHFEPSSTNQRP